MSAASITKWETKLSEVKGGEVDVIRVRGLDLASLIGKLSFAGISYLILTGREPTVGQSRVLDALFVASMDHGISPPAMISRCFASYGTTLQAAIGGGVLSFGETMGGAGEALAKALESRLKTIDIHQEVTDQTLQMVAREMVDEYRRKHERVPGFGIPLHRRDPRTPALMQVAKDAGVFGVYCRLLLAVEAEIEQRAGKPIPANLDGAGAALVLDLGLPVDATRMFIITPRTVSMTAHFLEEKAQGTAWRHVEESQISVDNAP